MNDQDRLLWQTRRHFFGHCALGIGSAALASLLGEGRARGESPSRTVNPLATRPPHFAPRARSVIYLFMAGGPSQLELFDYKPRLQDYDNQPIPESFIKGKRFAFMDTFAKEPPRLLATKRKFAQHGQSGAWVSECLPELAGVAD